MAGKSICRIKYDFTVSSQLLVWNHTVNKKSNFQTFDINTPVTGTATDSGTNPTTTGGSIGDCTKDSFTVGTPGNRGSPVICGFNTGQHSKSWFCKMNLLGNMVFTLHYSPFSISWCTWIWRMSKSCIPLWGWQLHSKIRHSSFATYLRKWIRRSSRMPPVSHGLFWKNCFFQLSYNLHLCVCFW